MTLKDSLHRWLLVTFPPSDPAKKTQRLTALLWRQLQKEKPSWYNPVNDRLTPGFGVVLDRLRSAALGVARAMGIADAGPLPPSFLPQLVERLAGRYLENAKVGRDKLSFDWIFHEVSQSRGSDFRFMEHTLQARLKSLPRQDLAELDARLPALEGLLHLLAFDWQPLTGLLPSEAGNRAALGSDFAGPLEDLLYLIEPLKLEGLDSLEIGPEGPVDLRPLASALGALPSDKLKTLLLAVLGEPERVFKKAKYEPPTVTAVLQRIVAEFNAQLKLHQAEAQRQLLASRMSAVFGDRTLAVAPGYNETTNTLLLERKLPDLTHVDAIKVLFNFQAAFHESVFQKFFQGFQLQVDFVGDQKKLEFQQAQETYFQAIQGLTKFSDDLQSSAYSPLRVVEAALKAPFLEAKTKQALKKPLDETNAWADRLCQASFQSIKQLNTLFEKYLLDLNNPTPECFSGGSVLASKHPDLVEALQTGTRVLKGMSGILRHMVVDLGRPEGN